MRATGGVRIDEDASREVLVALYLRDALGVTDPSGLPRLLGTGLPPVPTADERTIWAWTRWWVSVTDPDSAVAPLAETGGEAFEALVRRHLDDARTWADVVHAAHETRRLEGQLEGTLDTVAQDAVAAWQSASGRPPRAFRLRIEVLPLTASGVWWIGEQTVAVDELLREDPVAWAQAITPIIERMAAE